MIDLEKELPKRIKLAAHSIEVIHHEEQSEEEVLYGEYKQEKSTIRISKDLRPEQLLDTLLHELLHAIYAQWNIQDEDDEERTVTALATGLATLFLENSHLLSFIRKAVKKAKEEHKRIEKRK